MKKKLIATILFISVLLVFVVLFIAPTVFIPVSKSLLDRMNPKEMELFFPLLLLFALYMTVAFRLLQKNTHERKIWLFMKLAAATFLMFPLMGFIESVFWLDSLGVVEGNEYVKIFFRSFITFLLFSLYLSLLAPKSTTIEGSRINLSNFKTFVPRLLLIGVLYLFIYNLFGYFVAWQFEATRVYYTGSSELKGFFTMLALNLGDPKFVLVHFFRGVLFGLSGYLLYTMLNCSKPMMILVMALVFGGFGFQIILPNPIFPEMVRISHFLETTLSMLVFGMITGYVFDYQKNKTVLA